MTEGRRRHVAASALVVLFAGVMTLATGSRGPWSETVYFELALDRVGPSSWLYPYDEARILMMLPYKLAVTITSDSYWAFQGIQFALLAAIGVLVFAIMRVAWRVPVRAAASAGVVAVVFGGDLSGAFSGMVIVRQAMAFWLIALLLFAIAARRSWAIALLAIPFELAAMFTYDPVIVVLAASPAILLIAGFRPIRALVAWYVPIAVVVAWQVWRYAFSSVSSYQSEQLAAQSLFEVIARIGHLSWLALTPAAWVGQWAQAFPVGDVGGTLAILGWCLVAATLAIALVRLLPGDRAVGAVSPHWGLLGAALIGLAAIGPYLAIASAFSGPLYPQGAWRSLLLAAVPLAMVSGIMVMRLEGRVRLQATLLVTLVVAGAAGGTAAQLHEQAIWDNYVETYRKIAALVPATRPGTLVVVDGMPRPSECARCSPGDSRSSGAFTSSIWFNSGLQLLYPGEGVVGTYIDASGQWAPDMTIDLDPSGANITYANVGVSKTRFAPSDVLVIDWRGGQPAIAAGRRAGWPFPLSKDALETERCVRTRTTPLGDAVRGRDGCSTIPGHP